MTETSLVAAADRRHVPCDSCGAQRARKLFAKANDSYVRCEDCGLVYIDPQPTDAELGLIYGEHYYDAWGTGVAAQHVAALKRRTFQTMLDRMAERTGVRSGKLLDLGCATGFLLEVARDLAFDPYGIEINSYSARQAQERFGADHIHCGTTDDHQFSPGSFSVVVMSDLLEHVRSPRKLLAQTHTLLATGGVLVVVAPNVGGLSSKLLRKGWTDYKREHLFYFDRRTLAALLTSASFEVLDLRAFPKFLDLSYIHQQLRTYPTPLFTPLVSALHKVVPDRLARTAFPIFAGSMMAVARKI